MPDPLNQLGALAAVLLAASLATERLLTIFKTLIPWLAVEKTTAAQEVDLSADKSRRLLLQACAILASYVTIGLIFNTWDPGRNIPIGSEQYPQGVLAFLGSAGSAFWNGVVGYVKEGKNARTVELARARLQYVYGRDAKAGEVAGTNLTGLGITDRSMPAGT
jgi:hypothetical protein